MLSSSEDEYVYRSARRVVYWDTPETQMNKQKSKKIIEHSDSSEAVSANDDTASNSSSNKMEIKNEIYSSQRYKEIGGIDDFSESSSSSNEKNEDSESEKDEGCKDSENENKKSEDVMTENEENEENINDTDVQEQDDLKWLKSFVKNQPGNFWTAPNPGHGDANWNSAEPPTKDSNTEGTKDNNENADKENDVEKIEEEEKESEEFCEDENCFHNESDSNDVEENGSQFLKDRLEKLQVELSSMRKELAETRLALEKERKEVEEQEKAAQHAMLISAGDGYAEHPTQLSRPYSARPSFSELKSDTICRPLTVSNISSYDLKSKLRNSREDASAGYKATLDTLEKLMNDELSNIQDNIGKLEPLTIIASNWETEPIQERKSFVYRHDYTVKVVSSQGQAETVGKINEGRFLEL